MYLVYTFVAAIVTTIIWLRISAMRELRLGTLCLIYWGASIMWIVDFVIACIRDGICTFETGADAALLGGITILLGVAIWGSSLLFNKTRRKYGN